LLPADTAALASSAAESATSAAQTVAQSVEGAAQTVTQGVEGAAQTVAQGVAQGVERRLTSPQHAARTLRRMRWVYAPGVALGLGAALAARRWAILPGDREALRAVQRAQSPLADRVMTAVAAPGFPPLSVELLGAGAVALWLARLRLESGFLLAAAGGVTLVDVTLKRLIKRQRPTDGLARVLRLIEAPSFPSGHVMNYVSVFGFLAVATIANTRPSPLRTAITTACAGMVALIGPARVYLGAHWPSDTLAGYLFGGLYLGGLLEAYTLAKGRQAERHAR
jgi:undecaprenyl-diphosphatase